jgi:hypothetical protein
MSVRVGPKAIASVLPAVHASVEPVEGWFRSQLAIVAVGLGERRAADELLAYVSPITRQLLRELSEDRPLNARTRLHLEKVILPLLQKLDAARALSELLEHAAHMSAMRISLPELLREAAKGIDGVTGGGDVVHAMLRIPHGGEVIANPRVSVLLLGVGARLVSESTQEIPCISAVPAADRSSRLVISPIGTGGEAVTLVAPSIIEPTLTCVHAAARAAGSEVRWDAAKHEYSLLHSA